jgi:hypothetical protein
LLYDRAVKASPVLTKALTSFTGFAVGDRIAQSVTGGAFDPYRWASGYALAAFCRMLQLHGRRCSLVLLLHAAH